MKRWRSQAGTPELVPENFAEIVSLCERGSWNKDQWAFLESQGGSGAVERALATLEASGAHDKLLGVCIHVFGDMRRAMDIYITHVAATPELRWATTQVAEFLSATEPERAAELFVEQAERRAIFGNKSSYRASVAALAQAKTTLVRADLYPRWKTMLARFMNAHRRRKHLMAALASAFPGEL